jgi:hypothetical protein
MRARIVSYYRVSSAGIARIDNRLIDLGGVVRPKPAELLNLQLHARGLKVQAVPRRPLTRLMTRTTKATTSSK